jgi:hypothetical protein
MTDERKPKPKFAQGSKVRVVASKDDPSQKDSREHQGKTGHVTACKPTEHAVVFLYDVVLDADETTLQFLPESCLESV